VARQQFADGQSLDTVMDAIAPDNQKGTLAGDIQQLTVALKRHSWTTLVENRGDARLLEQVEEAERLLRDLKKVLG